MAFIDRFLKVPIMVYNIEDYEITNIKTYENSVSYILPGEIAEFYPTTSDGRPAVSITTKGGKALMAEMCLEDFIDLANKHFQI